MLSPIRERAKMWIDKIPSGRWITSNGDEKLFTELTGGAPVEGFPSRHAWLLNKWKTPGDITTTCNEFVGAYGRALGFTGPANRKDGTLGRFDIAAYLKSIGKWDAWVPSTDDVRPGYGDICRFKALHMGISLTWDLHWTYEDGSKPSEWTWYTVESGQGGKKMGCDVIQRKKYPDPANRPSPCPRYTPKLLEGWVDIDILFRSISPTDTTADRAVNSLWLNKDGDVIHPDAPIGGGGPGYFRSAGTLSADPFSSNRLPHPSAPAVRYLDPLKIG